MSFAVLVGLTSCEKDDNNDDQRVEDAEFQTLTTYMADNGMDLPDVLTGWIITPADVNAAQTDADPANDFYIIDIRNSADYAAGHIDGAVNCALGDILDTAANAGGKTIVVCCYTGQSAAHAVIALRLSNYADAKTMKWGMSGWHSTLDKWTSNIGSDGSTNANWVAAPGNPAEAMEFDDPNLEVTATDGAGMLAERVEAMLNGGFQGIANADVLGAPTDYFINNFWDEADVDHYGHIKTAFRIKPLTIAGGEMKNLNPEKTVVTYCWTGQTSSMITAYLTVLGYDAKSLKFGANGMIYDDLTSHKWSAPSTDLPLAQ